VFAPGDQITINAGGCVQTGGWGATWKRYVNPSSNPGPSTSDLYYGSMEIPGPLAKTRFSKLIGKTVTISPSIISPPNLETLVLYYADDNYSDNGYYDHDNGTGNQCAGADGGPAHVTLTIVHTTPLLSGPCGTDDCNIIINQIDANTELVDITRPVVTLPSFDYESIVLGSGDSITIDDAGGCVRIGGPGTWKRYVNPSGPNTDQFFFGSIRIRVADLGSAPARIFDVLGETRFLNIIERKYMLPTIGPTSLATLALLYADYHYSDNGYDRHDNGTGNQCALQADGGDAHVAFTIVHP
jgi:hypothetical protein